MDISTISGIGKLEIADKQLLNEKIENFSSLLEKKSFEEAQKFLKKLSKSPNYFVREYLGESLVNLKNQKKIIEFAKEMLDDKFYGTRATAIIYLYNVHKNNLEKIIPYLSKVCSETPWETENIIKELWKKIPDTMKKEMLKWQKSKNEKMRAFSFLGLESILETDPNYVMDFIRNSIEDKSNLVAKKTSYMLTQIARIKPEICYPYLYNWIQEANGSQTNIIWNSMKKIVSIINQKNSTHKNEDFLKLTKQTIIDWENDQNKEVAKIGRELKKIVN